MVVHLFFSHTCFPSLSPSIHLLLVFTFEELCQDLVHGTLSFHREGSPRLLDRPTIYIYSIWYLLLCHQSHLASFPFSPLHFSTVHSPPAISLSIGIRIDIQHAHLGKITANSFSLYMSCLPLQIDP